MRSERIETICSLDPELDTSRIDPQVMGEYLRSRESLDPIRHAFSANGPTLYTIREIPHQLWESFVERGDTDEEKYRRAFMVGLVSVKNLYQADGTRIASWAGSRSTAIESGQIEVLTDSDLKLFSPAERMEIGSVAYQHSFLARRIGSCFQLPPSVLKRLGDRDFRSAGSSPTSPATPNAAPSAPEAT